MNKDQITGLMFSISKLFLLVAMIALYGADTWAVGFVTWVVIGSIWYFKYFRAFNGQAQFPGYTPMYVAAVMSNIMMLFYTPEAMNFLLVCVIVDLTGVYFSEGKYDELKAQLSAA